MCHNLPALCLTNVIANAWADGMSFIAEPSIAIIICCTIRLKPLYRQIFPRKLSTSNEKSGSKPITFGRGGGSNRARRLRPENSVLKDTIELIDTVENSETVEISEKAGPSKLAMV